MLESRGKKNQKNKLEPAWFASTNVDRKVSTFSLATMQASYKVPTMEKKKRKKKKNCGMAERDIPPDGTHFVAIIGVTVTGGNASWQRALTTRQLGHINQPKK